MIQWDFPFSIDENQDVAVKPELLVSQRPSLYSIDGAVSMHPTVLYLFFADERER